MENAKMTTRRTENHLADVLRILMSQAGIKSDNELADRLDAFENGQAGPAISQATISRILNGSTRDPRAETVRRMARFFGLTESQMRGLEPLDAAPSNKPATDTAPLKVADAAALHYPTTPPGEPGAGECLALLADFARLPAVKRQAVTRLAHDLRHRDITEQTPLYTLEEISRAVQASLFFGTHEWSQQREHELRQTLAEVATALRMQKSEFFSHKSIELKHKTSKV